MENFSGGGTQIDKKQRRHGMAKTIRGANAPSALSRRMGMAEW
jgi:hypothetical protein